MQEPNWLSRGKFVPSHVDQAFSLVTITAGAPLAILMIALYVFFNRRHIEPHYRTLANQSQSAKTRDFPLKVPGNCDVRSSCWSISVIASPQYGDSNQGEASPSPQVIPSSPLINLNLPLCPLGARRRRYSVKG